MRRRHVEDPERQQRRWGIGLTGALAVGLGVAVLAPSGRPAPQAAPTRTAAPRPAPPPEVQPPPDEAAARAQAAFWVWPLLGAGFEQDLQFDE